jgi:hypothetical protein
MTKIENNSKKSKNALFKRFGLITHGAAAGISMAMLLALFIAGENPGKSYHLAASAILLALSLGTNSFTFELLKHADKDAAYKILYTRKSRHLSYIGIRTFLAGVLFFTTYYESEVINIIIIPVVIIIWSILENAEELITGAFEKTRTDK